jgi:transcriptional regulator with XRE-family HTH domain
MENERLRVQRQLRGWSQEDVARGLVGAGIEIGERQLGVTRHLVSRWERGITSPRAPYPKILCRLFNTTADELGLVSPSRQVPVSVTIEGSTIADGDEVERRDFLGLFSSAARAAAVWAVLPTGIGRAVTSTSPPRGSLEAIASVVNAYRQAQDGIPSHHLLGPVLAHLDHVHRLIEQFGWSKDLAATAANTSLLAAWLADHLRDDRSAGQHHRAAVVYAQRAGSPALEAYMAGCMGFWAGQAHLPDEAERCLVHARSVAPPEAQARLAVFDASVQAWARNTTDCLRSLERAEEATALDSDPLWPEAFGFDQARVTRYRGGCASDLGLVDMALPALEQALVAAPPGLSKSRGRILVELAMSHVHADEIEEACRLTGEAFDIAAGMSYARLLGRVQEVRRAFPAPWKGAQAVRELDETMAGGLVGSS